MSTNGRLMSTNERLMSTNGRLMSTERPVGDERLASVEGLVGAAIARTQSPCESSGASVAISVSSAP